MSGYQPMSLCRFEMGDNDDEFKHIIIIRSYLKSTAVLPRPPFCSRTKSWIFIIMWFYHKVNMK